MPILTLISTFFGGLSSTTYIILGLSILISVGAIWFHNTENQLRQDASAKTALQISVDNQSVALAQAQTDANTIQDIDSALSILQQADAGQAMALLLALNKLDDYAVLNPSLVEAKINRGSDNRNRCLALATGAVPVKGEINPVCTQLLPKQVK